MSPAGTGTIAPATAPGLNGHRTGTLAALAGGNWDADFDSLLAAGSGAVSTTPRNGHHNGAHCPEDPGDPLPAFPRVPVGKLAGPLAWMVDWAVRDGLHAECMLPAALAALASLTGPARLKFNETKTFRAVLWIALVGIASAGKSPAFEHAFMLIRKDYELRYEQYESELDTWEQAAATLGKAKAGLKPRRPAPVTIKDATVEAVARWLVKRQKDGRDSSGGLILDELALFLEGLNAYRGGQGADVAKWLEMWTPSPLDVERVGKGDEENGVSIYVAEPVVSIAGPLTPDNIPLLGKQGSGFRPRWTVFLAPSEEPRWLEAGGHPQEWDDCIKALLADRKPREWFLKGEGRETWKTAAERWRRQQDRAEPDDVIEALRKADSQCLRVMLVVAESMNPGAGGDIPLDAVECAIAVTDYVIDAWRALPGHSVMIASRYEEVMSAVYQRFLAWLETRPKGNEGLPEGSPLRPRASRRETQRWLHEKPAKIAELLKEHAAWHPGCVVEVERERDARGHGGGITVWAYAPERRTPGVAATPGMVTRPAEPAHVTAGQEVERVTKPGVAGRDTGTARHRVRDTGFDAMDDDGDDPPAAPSGGTPRAPAPPAPFVRQVGMCDGCDGPMDILTAGQTCHLSDECEAAARVKRSEARAAIEAASTVQAELAEAEETAVPPCQVCGVLPTGADEHSDCTPASKDAPKWPAFNVMRKTLDGSRMHPVGFIRKEDRDAGPWPFAIEADRSAEAGFRWQLPGADGMDGMVIPFDRSQSFPSACSSVPVAASTLAHHGSLDVNPKDAGEHGLAGVVKVVVPPGIEGMPHPLGKRAVPGEEMWIPSGWAEMLWKLHAEGAVPRPVVTDSWMGRRTVGLFDPYAAAVRDARKEHRDNPEMTTAVKRSASIVLRVLYPTDAKSPWWRPDWRAAIVGEAMTRLWMVAWKAVQGGAVLASASNVDAVAYLVDMPSYIKGDGEGGTWAPPGYKIGSDPGTYHWGDTRYRAGTDLTGVDTSRVSAGPDPKVLAITGPVPLHVWVNRRG